MSIHIGCATFSLVFCTIYMWPMLSDETHLPLFSTELIYFFTYLYFIILQYIFFIFKVHLIILLIISTWKLWKLSCPCIARMVTLVILISREVEHGKEYLMKWKDIDLKNRSPNCFLHWSNTLQDIVSCSLVLLFRKSDITSWQRCYEPNVIFFKETKSFSTGSHTIKSKMEYFTPRVMLRSTLQIQIQNGNYTTQLIDFVWAW